MRADCHMHMILDGYHWKTAILRHEKGPEEGFIRAVLAQYQKDGYTYLRDGGDRWGAGRRARELSREYGIRYRTPLSPISRRGHYGGFIGEQFSTMKEYALLVRKMGENGADFIKIMISGLMDFDVCGRLTEEGLEAAQIREMIHIAHEEGFAVMAHANGARTVEAAAIARVDSVEHGAYLDRDALQAMQENGCVWVPTISTIGNLRGKGRFREEAVQAIFASAAQNLQQFAAMGGLIGCGSDAGAWAVPHGCNTEEGLLASILGEGAWEAGDRVIMEKF